MKPVKSLHLVKGEARSSTQGRTRPQTLTVEDAKRGVLGAANLVVSIFDIFEAFEAGEETLPALHKAVRKNKRRAKKLREAEEEETDK